MFYLIFNFENPFKTQNSTFWCTKTCILMRWILDQISQNWREGAVIVDHQKPLFFKLVPLQDIVIILRSKLITPIFTPVLYHYFKFCERSKICVIKFNVCKVCRFFCYKAFSFASLLKYERKNVFINSPIKEVAL